ncbi:TPA: hypothetical protein QDC20_003641 [Burkholderia aenigmatica]|uniref:hypothetical protein n=1 Tax=Burkholderia sp. AU45251 TaxID=3059204 RepID=UPI00264E2645|nr:hypothetical protein [Burkholderia sp. AU45251]HDR9482824.1 hypothetical protein [Burkholderia aenigmatica]MDN7519492.1 hypothetical protein [Burkholderia sp. AU45251]HDR9513771.1 hypothetical protein [Burkholderia aenigmatica]HDR9591162.1 hypothetical protein [Burkholderia aenigmatica]HDR9599144.1 hypothetical protein [Burkholderia aenigmatica]
MKALLLKLFRRRAEQAPALEVAPSHAPAPTPREPAGKRRYGKRKSRHPAPRGAYKADWNEPILRGDRR